MSNSSQREVGSSFEKVEDDKNAVYSYEESANGSRGKDAVRRPSSGGASGLDNSIISGANQPSEGYSLLSDEAR
jgi:hypothetical protein